MEFNHKSIMLEESINGLNINPDGIYVDGTLGGAGHSSAICHLLSDKGTLIGVDQDINAIDKASQVLKAHLDKTIIVRGNFFNIENILQSLDIMEVDGFLLDLGVSSHQLDEPTRGFSYMHDAPLDMRMDTSSLVKAYDIVNKYDEQRLTTIISQYGEERWAKRIAEFIVSERKIKPINTTFELVTVIKKAVPKAARLDGPHPAKRTFQAIRIELNQELEHLEKTIIHMVDRLKPGGRICIITFHSLEDRIVKNTFRNLENPCTCPTEFPVCMCKKEAVIKLITKRPIIPTEDEVLENNRARSAKLRIAEKI